MRSVDEAYERLYEERKAPCRTTFEECLDKADYYGLIDRRIDDTPIWIDRNPHKPFGYPGWEMAHEWFRYVRMGLDGGYYGLASVDYHENGPFQDTDHKVLIRGARERPEKIIGGGTGKVLGRKYICEVLVSCSARGSSRWVGVLEFLRNHGGYNVILIRPTPGK